MDFKNPYYVLMSTGSSSFFLMDQRVEEGGCIIFLPHYFSVLVTGKIVDRNIVCSSGGKKKFYSKIQ